VPVVLIQEGEDGPNHEKQRERSEAVLCKTSGSQCMPSFGPPSGLLLSSCCRRSEYSAKNWKGREGRAPVSCYRPGPCTANPLVFAAHMLPELGKRPGLSAAVLAVGALAAVALWGRRAEPNEPSAAKHTSSAAMPWALEAMHRPNGRRDEKKRSFFRKHEAVTP
jgi:hypothetical protein